MSVTCYMSQEHLGSYRLKFTVNFNGLAANVKVRVGMKSRKYLLTKPNYILAFPANWLKLYIDEYLVAEQFVVDVT